MGLFNKSNKVDLPVLSDDNDQPQAITFNEVIDYITGLSKSDFDKLIKVANIYRASNKDVLNVLGLKDEPTTSIAQEMETKTLEPVEVETDLLSDDELDNAFLDEPELDSKKRKVKKAKK